MAILEQETFDGLSDGATIGTGNTSFDSVTGTSLDATTDAIHGTGAMDVSVASSTHTCRWETSVSGRTVLHSRLYLEVVSGFSGNDAWFGGCGNTGGSVGCFVSTVSSGALKLLQSDEAGQADTSTLTLGLGDVARIEHVIDLDSGTQSADIYVNANVEGTTPDETISTVATMSDLADWRIGRVLSRDVPFIVDEVAIGDAAIGPIGGGGATDLDGSDTAQAQTAAAAALTQTHELGADATTQAQSATSPALTQTHELTATDAVQAQQATAAALTQVHELQPSSAVQGQSATAAALVQTHELVAADAVQQQVADGATLVQAHELTAADAVQAQAADTAAVAEGVTLSPASAVQGQSAATAALTQVHALTAADVLQAQSADAAALTQLHELVAASAMQGQIVVLPALTLGEIATPASRTFTVQAEDRTFSIPAEDRTFEVAAESRRFAVT